MKILYGIQGTGNGHISRARMMAHYFQQEADVTYLLTGRSLDKLFDRDVFGAMESRRGLTFSTQNGNIDHIQTALSNNAFRFIYDVCKLKVDDYDLVITDFEPVTAWASRFSDVPTLAIGHQYAFDHAIPKTGVDLAGKVIMKNFTPAQTRIGLHWHHFNCDILPPIVDPTLRKTTSADRYFVVYLPFENQQRVTDILHSLKDYKFIQYSPDLQDSESGNVVLRKTSLNGFKRDLSGSNGVICNAGFELVSECLYINVPVLVKPLMGQMEQRSNAKALSDLHYGAVMETLDVEKIRNWISAAPTVPSIQFGDVAKTLVEWILNGRKESVSELKQRLW